MSSKVSRQQKKRTKKKGGFLHWPLKNLLVDGSGDWPLLGSTHGVEPGAIARHFEMNSAMEGC
jgi:hypothetical protein